MKLKHVYDKLEEVPDNFRDLYTERDGKWECTGIEGMHPQTYVDKLKAESIGRRKEIDALKGQLKNFEGYDGETLSAAMEELEELRLTGGKLDDAKFNEALEAKLAGRQKTFERQLAALQKDNDVLTADKESLMNEKNSASIEKALRDACQGKVNASAVKDVLFRSSLFEVNEDGIYTKENNGVTPGLTPDQFLEETLPSMPHWNMKNSGLGAGGSKTPGQLKDNTKYTTEQIITESVSFND
jgi:hypothetical protein